MQQQTILITGANTGIGRATAEALAARGAHLVLAGRSRERTEPVLRAASELAPSEPEFLELDLASLASVRRCAETFLRSDRRLDVLINNAGVAGSHSLTKDGFELAFGINHLGHFLLTQLLGPRLQASAPARVVTVASAAHFRVQKLEFDALTRPAATRSGFPEYAVSKLCNVLFSRELAKRWAGTGVTSYAVHPGVIASDIWRRLPRPVQWLMGLFMQTPEQGARASVRCAVDPELAAVSGRYYDATGTETKPSRLARDDALAAQLWERSAQWVAPFAAPIDAGQPSESA